MFSLDPSCHGLYFTAGMHPEFISIHTTLTASYTAEASFLPWTMCYACYSYACDFRCLKIHTTMKDLSLCKEGCSLNIFF